MGSGAPDVWWFRPDGRKMTQRNWRDGNALTLGVFLNGSEIPTHDAAGCAGDRRQLPDPLQRLRRADRVHAARRVASARRWRTSSRPPSPSVERATRAPARGVVAGRGRSLVAAPSRRLMTDASDVPAPAGARASASARRAELVPYLRDLGVSHLYLSPSLQARHGSTHGYDVVDPTRISEDLGGEDEFRELCAAGGSGVVLRHRPEPHGDERREPVLARPALAREVLRPRLAHRAAPPVLRRRRARRRADGGSRGLRGDAREGRRARAARALIDGVRDRPSRRAREPARATSSGCARPGSSTSGSRRSSSRASGCAEWPVEGTTGYEFLERRHGALRRSRRRGAADAAVRGADRRASGRSPSSRPRRSSSRRGRPSSEEAAQLARQAALRSRRRGGARRASTSTAPTSSRTRARRRTTTAPRSSEAGLPDGAGADPPARGARARRVRRPLPADDAARARQGRRGHRLLPLEPLRRAERGRRRPRPLLALGRRASTRRTCARPPGRPARDDDPRHQAKRGRPGAARRAASPPIPPSGSAVVRPRIEGWRDPNEAYLILQTVVGAWPLDAGAARRSISRRRCARRR